MEQNLPGPRQGVSAALAAAQARAAIVASVRFPGEDGGRSLAEMAQRDLDAALQLLADRAQYITGASGAAIALRRDGREDMLCRASVGSNAPELGALLSTEFGLSGESVRTRQLLRCDDAERDARVNREVCRQMGIASVLVMPVVNDDQVLGVFELFSGKANAFGERDLSAVQRLSEMVETAVRLAHATETLPEQLTERESSVAEAVHPEVFEGQFLGDLVVEGARAPAQPALVDQSIETIAAAALESPVVPGDSPSAGTSLAPTPELRSTATVKASQPAKVTAIPEKKPLFWSAAAAGHGDGRTTSDANQSHIPPMLRGLRKCEACGFPISAGRILCVECEEKKWRGQLRLQATDRTASLATASTSKPLGGNSAAAVSTVRTEPAAPVSIPAASNGTVKPATPAVEATAHEDSVSPACVETTPTVGTPSFVLGAALEPTPSWFSANKYILAALLVIGTALAGYVLLR